jgi:NAD-dependent histone deacetylase SIR2
MSLHLLSEIVPTFETMSVGSRKIFDMSMFGSPKSTALLNKTMCDMYHQIEAASPTQLHLVIAALAEEGRLQRLYTQNIDGIDTQLPPLKTLIPLPKEKPWPKTIQLHSDLRTIRCQMYPCTHLSHFDPALFTSGSLPFCAECEEDELLNEGRRRARAIPVIRPRIWLYNDFDYPDAEAIDKVRAADLKAKPDAVIVVGTALEVESAKAFARDMCRTARKDGGFTAWINLKAPPQDLDCFDLVVKGDCDTVAMHVSSWWLKECPNVLSNTQIQNLQEKCKLFIARSTEEALNRALAEVDDDSLSKILQQQENKSRVLNVEEGGKVVFISAERPQSSGLSTWKAVNHDVETVSQNRKNPSPAPTIKPSESPNVLPKLPDCWQVEMSKRLSEVVVRGPKESRESSSVVTKIANLGYREVYLAKSLWRLKLGEELNDDVLNSYLRLLQRSGPVCQSIQLTGILNIKPDSLCRRLNKLIQTSTYSIFVLILDGRHWTFAVLRSENKGDPVCWEYYNSLSRGPPQKFLDWLDRRFPNAKLEKVSGSPNPIQRNVVDCGLFVLIGIRLMSTRRQNLSQAQSEDIIPTFRQRVLAKLLASSLNPLSNQFEEFKLKEAHADSILPQVNLAEKIGNRSTSTTASGQSHQVDRPKGDNPSRSFVSPSPYSDPREDTKTVSSDALDESEEELDQVKALTQKVPKKKKSPKQIASTFAEEASMVKMLREAVSIERASQKGPRNPKIENMQLADLWFMISIKKRLLKQRHVHYKFSHQF